MAQCTAKSKQSGVRCKNGASEGMTKCHMHGGKTPSKHGGYSKKKKVIETSIPDEYTDDLIKVNQDILKTTIEQYKQLLEANELYYKEREETSKGGLELSELSRGGVDKKGIEFKTIHRKRDFSTELNAKARLIKEFSKTILDMKRELGIVDSNDKIIFDIKF